MRSLNHLIKLWLKDQIFRFAIMIFLVARCGSKYLVARCRGHELNIKHTDSVLQNHFITMGTWL